MADATWWETIKVESSQLVSCVKHVVREGNVRRIRIKHEGQTIAEFPLTVGVVGTVFAPVLAAIGALAALLSDCTIEIERVGAPAATEVPEPRDGATTGAP